MILDGDRQVLISRFFRAGVHIVSPLGADLSTRGVSNQVGVLSGRSHGPTRWDGQARYPLFMYSKQVV